MHELARGATHIVHCAAIAGVDTVLESPVRTMRVNMIGTYNVLEAALATLDTLERFVDFSTSEVFGTHAFRVEEGQVSTIGSVGEARWTYAVSKLAGEHMAHAYHDELGLPAVTVHPFNVFGPGQIGGGAIRAFIEAALAGRDLTIHGDGSQIRAWCYVDDMVDGALACLERPEAVGQAFNIGNPRSTVTIYDLAQRIKRLTGGTGEIIFQPLHYADVELRIPNVEKARELLGFEAKVELDEGLAEDDRVVPGEGTDPHPPSAGPTSARRSSPRSREVLESGQLDDGPAGGRVRGELAPRVRGRARGRGLVRHRGAPSRRARARDRPGDEVLVPAYTFPATANVVALAGATPVLVDVDPATMNLDPARSRGRDAADEGGARRAPLRPPARLGGAAERGAAECCCSRTRPARSARAGAGRPAAGSGRWAASRFHPRKIVTTGEGGAVTTNDAELADAIRRLRNHGWRRSRGRRHARARRRTTASRTSSARSGSRSCAGSTSCSPTRDADRGRATRSGSPAAGRPARTPTRATSTAGRPT